jgi:dTDP-4-dehydrorhamnose reductase
MDFACNDPTRVPTPLLVTGITGVAGYNAFQFFRKQFPGHVIGIRPRQTWRLAGDGIVPLDIEDTAGLRSLFAAYRFRGVLNCIGNCALKSCELDPVMAERLNVDSAAAIVANVRAHRCRLVHLSSDLVFSGKGVGNYREDDPVDPVTIYGKTMATGERLVAEREPAAPIVRISLPMGPSFNGHAGAIDWIQSRFRHRRPATLYFDEVRSCTYVEDLNCVFARFLAGTESGIWHLGGPRPMTLYRIAQVVNRVGGYEPHLLKGCFRIEAGPVPPRAGNVSMCSDQLSALLGIQPFEPWPLEDELLPTHHHWHFDRPVVGSLRDVRDRLYRLPKQAEWNSANCTSGS